MRSLGFFVIVPLAACFTPNPGFGLATESTGGEVSTGTATASTSSASEPTSTTRPTTTAITTMDSEGGTASSHATSEPATSTSEPLTSTSEPATSTSTADDTTDTTMPDLPPAGCGFADAGDQTRYVLVAEQGNIKFTDCFVSNTWYGPLSMKAGTLGLVDDPDCVDPVDPPDLILGQEWPSVLDREYNCTKATIYWIMAEGECRIGTLQVTTHDPQNMIEPKLLYLASLSYPSKPPNFSFWPGHFLSVPCGCDNEAPCCMPDDAGEYKFDALGIAVENGAEAPFMKNGLNFRFKSIQSYVGPGCQQNPMKDIHFDWFVERTD